MKKREYKYLKGDKWMSFMGGEPFLVPAKHWFMRRRCEKMTTEQYIRWKHQQVIQSELNEVVNIRRDGNGFEIIQLKELSEIGFIGGIDAATNISSITSFDIISGEVLSTKVIAPYYERQAQLDAMFFLGEHKKIMESQLLPEIEVKRQGDNIAEQMLPYIEKAEDAWRKWMNILRDAKPKNQQDWDHRPWEDKNQGENDERSVATDAK